MCRGVSIAAFGLITLVSLASTSTAAVVINVKESGNDLFFDGAGSINLTALGALPSASGGSFLRPSTAALSVVPSPAVTTLFDRYQGIVGPANFGTGGAASIGLATGSGDSFLLTQTVASNTIIGVESGYVSGSNIAFTQTWSNSDLSSLGLTPGTYSWTWGTGINADSVQMNIQVASVPEPSSLAFLSLVVTSTIVRRRRRN